MATESQNSETGGVNQDEGVSKSTTVPPSKGVSYLSLVGAVLVTFGLTFGLTYGLLKRDGDGDSCSQTASFSDAPTWTDPLGLRGISHISINVPDIDEAIEFYNRTIGFEIMSGGDLWGDFIFYDLQNEAFCKDAGFLVGNCKSNTRVILRNSHLILKLDLLFKTLCVYRYFGCSMAPSSSHESQFGALSIHFSGAHLST